jgi:DNA mismatch repair protein MutL
MRQGGRAMEESTNGSPRIKILRDSVARTIAAGEVIDRPFSVVRELLDNSLDAESGDITVSIEDGGISRIRVTDNGHGMCEEDLRMCFLPHATSKIETFDDIYHITSLGFRGEALSSIATCSRLEIISSVADETHGNRLIVGGGKLISLEPYMAKKGTIVDVSEIFDNMPARKKFLKSISGESAMCRAAFLDKALPFPETNFRYFVNNSLKLFLPKAFPEERVAAAYSDVIPSSSLEVLEETADLFSLRIIAAAPELCRKDKRYVQIFVNKRRVYEFALVQAVEYGYGRVMPGKDYPVAFVFLDINPELVDFNIHPAKKECRIRIIPRIRATLISLLTGYLTRFAISVHTPEVHTDMTESPGELTGFDEGSDMVKETPLSFSNIQGEGKKGVTFQSNQYAIHKKDDGETEEVPRFLGQVFGLFLVAEYGDNLYIVDQHAAHERLLYDEFKGKESSSQELLFPISFDVTADEEAMLEGRNAFLEAAGIGCEKVGTGSYEITSLPSHLESIGAKHLIDFLKDLGGEIEELEHTIYSMAACRNAIKDGDHVDPVTATRLLIGVFNLENARCPHGRPIWHRITKDQLFTLLGRK